MTQLGIFSDQVTLCDLLRIQKLLAHGCMALASKEDGLGMNLRIASGLAEQAKRGQPA